MIFDDHEINDKWKTSQAWLDEMRQTDWYEGRVIGGLMAYWIYQHLGNLSPSELAEDETYQKLRDGGDGSEASATSPSGPRARRAIRGSASAATSARPGSSSSTRAPAASSRRASAGSSARTSGSGSRTAPTAAGHLLMASSLPFLLPYGMHDVEAWSEAIGDGAWGKRFKPFGEKVRIAANLDHWACFQRSYREFEELVIDIATGRCGEPPETLVMFGGDVHHCFVSR